MHAGSIVTTWSVCSSVRLMVETVTLYLVGGNTAFCISNVRYSRPMLPTQSSHTTITGSR